MRARLVRALAFAGAAIDRRSVQSRAEHSQDERDERRSQPVALTGATNVLGLTIVYALG
jgi:hypothetical protein